MQSPPSPQAARAPFFEAFPLEARAWIHELFARRRDVRHFEPSREVSADALRVILEAAHLAPSVGLSQPWRFIMVRDRSRRARIRDNFLACRAREADRFSGARRVQYLALQLEGILDAPLNVCIAADLRPSEEAILGTTAQPESIRASVVCAVQNLWLAARAEGLGVGWVSIVEPHVLREELRLPQGVEPVAYLCVGYPARAYERPMLEEVGWKQGVPLESLTHEETWQEACERET
jgi:5,6-dimethylbenzimidazole synthase